MDMHGLTKFGREFKIHAFRETERMKAERKRLEERRKGAAGDRSEDQPPEDKQSVDNSPENQVGGQSPGKESE